MQTRDEDKRLAEELSLRRKQTAADAEVGLRRLRVYVCICLCVGSCLGHFDICYDLYHKL
jgi:hypothetical protein